MTSVFNRFRLPSIAPEIEAYIRDLIDNDALIEAKELIQPNPPEEEA